MFPIQCEELRINQLTPFLVVRMAYACWFLWQAVHPSKHNPKLKMKTSLKIHIFGRAKSHLKGIQDFNLELWCWDSKNSQILRPNPSHELLTTHTSWCG